MNDILNYMTKQLISTFSRLSWVNGLEIIISLAILWVVYRRFIKGTQSENIVKGSFILVFVWIFSELLQIFQLNILGMFLKSIVIIVSGKTVPMTAKMEPVIQVSNFNFAPRYSIAFVNK